MIVHIVMDAGEHYIEGVFDSRDKAHALVIELNAEHDYEYDPYDNYYIETKTVQ